MKTPPSKNNYIIWADDDADDLMMMRDTLESFDQEHEVIEAHNGMEVLDYLEGVKDPSQLPCLIILDINMPVLGGRETLAVLKKDEKFKSIPVVMFTTSSSALDKMYCKRLGAEMFTKPDRFTDYQDVIKQLLRFCGNEN